MGARNRYFSSTTLLERARTFEGKPAVRISWPIEDENMVLAELREPYKAFLFITEKEVIYIPGPASESRADLEYYFGMQVLYGNSLVLSLRAELSQRLVRGISEVPEVVRLLHMLAAPNFMKKEATHKLITRRYYPDKGLFLISEMTPDKPTIHHGFIEEKSICDVDPKNLLARFILGYDLEHSQKLGDVRYIRTTKNLEDILAANCFIKMFDKVSGILRYMASFRPNDINIEVPDISDAAMARKSRYIVR